MDEKQSYWYKLDRAIMGQQLTNVKSSAAQIVFRSKYNCGMGKSKTYRVAKK